MPIDHTGAREKLSLGSPGWLGVRAMRPEAGGWNAWSSLLSLSWSHLQLEMSFGPE